MKDKRCNWPRGKVMGGSSVLNNMIHTRGHPEDYNHWASLGNSGWDWNSVLPYFLKSEDMQAKDSKIDKECHSTGGYLTLNHATWSTPLTDAFIKAATELGEDIVDYNGRQLNGYSKLQFTLRNGTRLSANRAFIHPASKRSNLHVLMNAQVTKILINQKTKVAYGVEYFRNSIKYIVKSRKEIIVSAGAINSAQILMLSGIGHSNHLKQLNIPIMADLSVGDHLQDHIALGGLTFLVNDSVSIRTDRLLNEINNVFEYMTRHKGPLSAPTGTEAIGFINTKNKSSLYRPDLELLFTAGSYVSEENYKDAFGIDNSIYDAVYKPIENSDTWMILPMLLLPKSKGKIRLRNSNPFSAPLLYPNYFDHPEDYEVILHGIRKSIRLSKTKAMQKYGSKLHDIPIPNCKQHVFNSDEYWKCAMRHLTQTIFHPCCTCRMGPHSDNSVVNEKLLVHGGIKGLRVADASIMPDIPTAHTNGPTIMIAEKAADLIKQDWEQIDNNSIKKFYRKSYCRLQIKTAKNWS